MASLLRDLRYTIRMLFQHPGFTAVALLSLALGIGANTTIFSVLNTILLRPFPMKDSERLVMLFETDVKRGRRRNPTVAVSHEWKKQSTVFESMAKSGIMGGRTNAMTLTGAGEAVRISAASVGPDFFSLAAVPPRIGRTFLPEDVPPGEAGSTGVVISHGLWERQFGADPQVLGQTFGFEGSEKAIIGVMPPDFWVFPWVKDTDAWIAYGQWRNLNSRWLSVIARLRPGVTLEQAQAEMDTIARRMEEEHPKTNKGWGIRVEPLQEWAVGGYRTNLYLLLGAVGFVLLIACANVANLLLVRAASRQKEIAIRAAEGARRLRLIRQLLTESVLLALIGGTLGVLVALWGIDIFVALAPEWFARAEEISIDSTVLLFTLGLAVLTGLVFGLAPALHASKPNLNESLKEAGTRGAGGPRHRGRSALVISEVALALVLLMGAGLMVNSFVRLQRVEMGFNSEDLLTANIFLAGPKYWNFAEGDLKRVTPQGEIFFQEVLQRVRALPGVVSASVGHNAHTGSGPRSFRIAGQPVPPPRERPSAAYKEVSPGFFQTMGIPLRKGRYLSERDVEGSPWVVVINEAMARKFFPDEDPIGKVLQLTVSSMGAASNLEEERPREIVGVVGDVRHWGPRWDPPPMMFGSLHQHAYVFPGGSYTSHLGKDLVVRTAVAPMSLAGSVRRIVAEVDKDQAVYDIMSMEQALAEWVAPQRFWMRLFGIFAALAVFLAVVGIYGVMAYSVNRRTHEIGVRMANGAQSRDVLKLVVGHGLKLTLIGVAIGIAGSFALTRLVARYLYEVKPTDPLTFAAVSLLLTAAALTASYIPARRASKLDPMEALRHE